MSKKIEQRVKDLENAIWMCHYWVQRLFVSRGDCREVWLYLFMVEELRDEIDKVTGGQNEIGRAS